MHLMRRTSPRRGMTLIEIIFAGAVLAIIAVGYLGAMSTTVGANVSSRDQTTADLLAAQELELLRATPFDQIPYVETAIPRRIEEVPDYLTNILATALPPLGNGQVGSTGDHADYPASLAVDGIRLDLTQGKWVGTENGPSTVPGGAWPPEVDNINDTVIGGSGTGVFSLAPPVIIDPTQPGTNILQDSQLWWINLRKVTRMHRILYDNRFNTYGDPSLELDPDPVKQADASRQLPGIYQRRFKLFASNVDLSLGIPFNPEIHEGRVMYGAGDLNIESSGVIQIWNNVALPQQAAVLGIGEIFTVSDSDPNFHYPYVGELEAYGFRSATAYVPSYVRENGTVENGNYVMFFPNYRGSDYDLARRVYWTPDLSVWPPATRPNVMRVEVEVMRHDGRRNTTAFTEQEWWQTDNSELTKLTSHLYRDGDITGARLPNLPMGSLVPMNHTNYRSGEDFLKMITVPGAESMRLHFDTFDLQGTPDTDYVQIYDSLGNQFGLGQYFGSGADLESLAGRFSPWIEGDTIVVRFHSDASGSSLPPANFGGMRVDYVEINGVPEDPTMPAEDIDPDVLQQFERDIFPRLPLDRLPEDQQDEDNFFLNPSFNPNTEAPPTVGGDDGDPFVVPTPIQAQNQQASGSGDNSLSNFILDELLDDGGGN